MPTIETNDLERVLTGPHGSDLEIDPHGSPPGFTIRVLYNEAPFLGQDQGTGVFQSSSPEAYARATDTSTITPEVSVVRVGGREWVVNRKEPVEGGEWCRLVLNSQ